MGSDRIGSDGVSACLAVVRFLCNDSVLAPCTAADIQVCIQARARTHTQYVGGALQGEAAYILFYQIRNPPVSAAAEPGRAPPSMPPFAQTC